MPEKLYTTSQIGELLGGKSARTIRNMAKQGAFGEVVKDGRGILISETGYEAYIKLHKGPPDPYQRHFTTNRPRRKLPEPQPLKT